MTKEERYDDLYQKAEDLMAKYNPCHSLEGKCRGDYWYSSDSFCCSRCKYLTKEGCSVKSLFCKLWTCWKTEHFHSREFKIEQHKLFNEAFYYKLLMFRGSKEDVMSKDFNMEECLAEVRGTENLHMYKIEGFYKTHIMIACGHIDTFYRGEE